MKRVGALIVASALLTAGMVLYQCGSGNGGDENKPTAGGHVIPGPGEPGYDAALEQQAERYFKAFATFSTAPFGMAFDARVGSTTDRAVIDRFVTQNPDNLNFHDFCLQDAKCNPLYGPYERIDVDGNTIQPGIIKGYGEWGDLGCFGGVAGGADLFRYAVLKEQGYPPGQVVEARKRVKKLLEAIHVANTIAGTPGVIVRGIRLLEFPPMEGPLMPLFDAEGNPLPKVKHGVMRPDSSVGGLYPGWAWADDTSKDQVDGWMFVMGAAWDVVAEDPDIPQNLKDWLQEDARNFGKMLRTVAPETGTDMVMRDGDGRLVTWCDVNPNVISFSGCPGATSPVPINSFNAIMGLGYIKVLYHITGDEELRAFYYDDLIGTRHWDEFINTALVPMVDTHYSTNYSNVNMAFMAYYNALRYEGDPVVRGKLQWSLEHVLWDNGGDRQPSEIHQTFFDVIFSGLRMGGNDSGVVSLGLQTLREFNTPLVWNDPSINCDAAEIAQGWCRAEDDPSYIIELAPPEYVYGGHGSWLVAEHVVPRRFRENSNYDWRSDPFGPNGGGDGLGLNHAGDWLAAYWMGRYFKAGTAEDRNISPIARHPVPPEAPTGLIAQAASETQINLTWTDATNKETGFEIERRLPPAGEFVKIGAVGMNVEAFLDLGVEANTTYEYRVKAVNKTGSSAYSNTASDTALSKAAHPPAAAENLVATVVDYHSIRLTWDDLSNNEDGFKVLREDLGAVFITTADVTEFEDTGLDDNTTYTYTVMPYNSAGDGWPFSNIAQATTPQLPGIHIEKPDTQLQVPIDLGEIQVSFDAPITLDDVVFELDDEVGPVNGVPTLDVFGTLLTFVPDPLLLTMETDYTITVTVDPVTVTYKFRTEGQLQPVDVAAGKGKAFAMNIFRATMVEPASLADMLGGLGLDAYLLLGIIDTDPAAEKMKFIGALGDLSGGDPTLQDMTMPSLLIPAQADISSNPMYTLGPFDFPIAIEGNEVTIKSVTMSGIFDENYNYSGKGEFQGDLDLGAIAGMVGMDPADLCAVIGECNPCPDEPGRVECVHLYIKNIRADLKADPLVPIAAVKAKDLGGTATAHTVELTLLHPETGVVQTGVELTVTVTSGNGTLDNSTVTTGADGKAAVILTDPDGDSDELTIDIQSVVPYLWVSSTFVVSFAAAP